ncbi:hypothetical protein ACX93W_05480 [Paenibacillus sp. CAU 1782]
MRKLEEYEQQFLNIMATAIRRKYEQEAKIEEVSRVASGNELVESEKILKSS